MSTIKKYFSKESTDGGEIQSNEEGHAKRIRSEGSTGGASPSSKQLALSDDETLLLLEDAPFWVPTLFKNMDKITVSIHVMSAKLEAFKNDVESRINDLKVDTESKIKTIAVKF